MVAPDGSRAGIVWGMDGVETNVILPPEVGRWGVYYFRSITPSDWTPI